MQDIQHPTRSVTGAEALNPRMLSDKELVQYYSLQLDFGDAVPLNWQVEVLRRLVKRLDTNQ